MKITILKRLALLVLLGGSLLFIYYLFFADKISLQQIQHSAITMERFIQNNYLLSVCLYLISIACAGAIALPITSLLTVSGGYFFGVILGTIYAAAGATFGGVIVFLTVRYMLGDALQKQYKERLQAINKEIDRYGHWYLMIAQISPMSPTALLNVLAGLTRMSLFQFIWADFLGLVPGSLVYALAGEKLHHIKSVRDIVSWELFVILLILTLMLLVPVVWKQIKN